MINTWKAAIAVTLTLVTASSSFAKDFHCSRFHLDKLPIKFGSTDLPGGMFAITKDGVHCESALGVKDLKSGAAMNPATPFPIASNTKMFTAAVVLQMVEQGKLQLDHPAVDYLPPKARQLLQKIKNISAITLLDLLRHSSGLPDYLSDPNWADPQCVNPLDEACVSFLASGETIHSVAKLLNYPDELFADKKTFLQTTWFDHFKGEPYFDPLFDLGYAVTHGVLDDVKFPSGTAVRYSNTNYLLLGLIIEAIEKLPIEEVFKQRIRSPLGLNDTFSLNRENPGFSLSITPYFGTMNFAGYYTGMKGYTDDGLVSTLGDLNRFIEAFARGQLFIGESNGDPSIFRKEALPTPNGNVLYSTGLMITDVDCGGEKHSVLYHTGKDPGFLSVAAFIPDCNASFVAMLNQSNTSGAAALLDKNGIFTNAVQLLCQKGTKNFRSRH